VTADATATLVWLAPAQPTREERDALATWASAHGIRFAEPSDDALPGIAVDPQIAASVEDQLERARAAMAAADGSEVDAALSSAESLLRAHAELPEAAWLMAEVERGRSARWRRVPPMDLEAADRAWARAEALDGGRVAGLGERSASPPPSSPRPSSPPPTSDLVIEGRTGTSLWVDGESALPGTIRLREGPHAIVVTQNGAPVWATWVDLTAATSRIRPLARRVAPCSRPDLLQVAPAGETIVAHGVRCGRWVAAERGSVAGAVRLSTCDHDQCGLLVEWRSRLATNGASLAADQGQSQRAVEGSRRGWPSWATWTLVAAGVAVAAGAIVLASGVWRSAPSETRFVGGGLVNGP